MKSEGTREMVKKFLEETMEPQTLGGKIDDVT